MKELSFPQALKQLEGYKVRTFINHSEIVDGILIKAEDDHIVLQIENKIFYYSFNQIHAVTKNAKNISQHNSVLPHESKQYLLDILHEFKYSWITIQSINNQFFSGLLSRITDGYVMLINEDDQIYIQKSFIVGVYKGNQEDIENEEKEDSLQTDNVDQNLAIQEEESSSLEPQRTESQLEDTESFSLKDSQTDTIHAEDPQTEEKLILNEESPIQSNHTLDILNQSLKENNITEQDNNIEDANILPLVEDITPTAVEIESINSSPDNQNKFNNSPSTKNIFDLNMLPLLPRKKKDSTENVKKKDYSIMPKTDNLSDYISHPLNPLGNSNLHLQRKKDQQNPQPQDTIEEPALNIRPVNTITIDLKEQNYQLEKQYYSLMKHAEFMYKKLRNERLKK
ncbi:DUF2642 domain-containing protein [Bacillus sp. B1-b2]|uniref:DUF2642 domain-containing protein n=1 Tax=Bacillus sp. B1-b2 TaxID=2653201 RepID=UPI001261AA12|nr:DUF2642 domain-containing protein [Bacillus sp. B1-b2]KAB7668411.1 DUF2642 domain-containing protein [Bacillus sp. B1-b2]